jgi:glycosyltransferase involved in cell wall biosynthesis
MKIGYLVSINDLNSTGVRRKVISQCRNIDGHGADVVLYVFINNANDDFENSADLKHINVGYPKFRGSNIISKCLNEILRSQSIRKLIVEFDSDVIVYIRYSCLNYIPKLKRARVIVEHQTKESIEWLNNGTFNGKIFFAAECMFGRRNRARCDGIVTMTNDIMTFQQSQIRKKINAVIIPNGVDVESISLRSTFPKNTETFQIISSTNVAPWHGLDRIIIAMASYSGSRNISLVITEEKEYVKDIVDLSEKLGLGDHVIFIGKKNSQELKKIFENSNLAAGTLAADRIGLKEVSSLKHREYCAAGIPFIYSGSDPDFPAEFPFAIRISNESLLNFEEIIKKCDSISSDEAHIGKMRKYALDKLDWKVKSRVLLDWLLMSN